MINSLAAEWGFILAKGIIKSNMIEQMQETAARFVFLSIKSHNFDAMPRLILISALFFALVDSDAQSYISIRAADIHDRVRPGRRQRPDVPNRRRHHEAVRIVRRSVYSSGEPPWRQRCDRFWRRSPPKGNAYSITSTSGNFLATPIVSDTGWTYRDFTPIGLLAQDAMFLVVRSDSAFSFA